MDFLTASELHLLYDLSNDYYATIYDNFIDCIDQKELVVPKEIEGTIAGTMFENLYYVVLNRIN